MRAEDERPLRGDWGEEGEEQESPREVAGLLARLHIRLVVFLLVFVMPGFFLLSDIVYRAGCAGLWYQSGWCGLFGSLAALSPIPIVLAVWTVLSAVMAALGGGLLGLAAVVVLLLVAYWFIRLLLRSVLGPKRSGGGTTLKEDSASE